MIASYSNLMARYIATGLRAGKSVHDSFTPHTIAATLEQLYVLLHLKAALCFSKYLPIRSRRYIVGSTVTDVMFSIPSGIAVGKHILVHKLGSQIDL